MDYFWCFLCGGALCAIGQILIDRTNLTPARILTGYVVAGVFLTAVGIYEPVKELCGAGATVPLTGFGYCLAKGVEEAVAKDAAKSGDIVILCPACASFDMFKNFEERGNMFKELVNRL